MTYYPCRGGVSPLEAVPPPTPCNTILTLKHIQIQSGFFILSKLNEGRRSSATLTGVKQRQGEKDARNRNEVSRCIDFRLRIVWDMYKCGAYFLFWRRGAEGTDAEASLIEARLETQRGFQVRLKAGPRMVESKIRTPRRPLSQDEKDALRCAWII